MASQEQVSSVFKGLGSKLAEAHNAAKDIPVNTGGGGLPDGIRGGVALISEMSFIEGKKEEDKGKFYFSAVGVVVHPQYHDSIKCAGRQTRQLIPFFDTPKRQKGNFIKDHYPKFRDLFEKLGIKQPPPQQPGESLDATNERVMNYYVSAMQLLVDKKVPFNFRTWKGDKQTEGEYAGKEPNVQEVWEMKCEWNAQGAAANPANAIAPPPSAPPVQPRSEPTQQAAPAAVPVPTVEQLKELGECADVDPDGVTDEAKDAKFKLSAASDAAGITQEEAGPLSWTQLAELIISRTQPASSPTEMVSSGTNGEPVKGDTCKFDNQQCVITSVADDTKLVTLKYAANGKSVLDASGKLAKIPFDQLS